MSKTEILEELPKLTKTERQEIRSRLAELDSEDWLDNEEPLTVHEKDLFETRLAAYAKDPDVGSTWEEVRAESEPTLIYARTDEPKCNRQDRTGGWISLLVLCRNKVFNLELTLAFVDEGQN